MFGPDVDFEVPIESLEVISVLLLHSDMLQVHAHLDQHADVLVAHLKDRRLQYLTYVYLCLTPYIFFQVLGSEVLQYLITDMS